MDPALDRMKVPRSDEVEQKLASLGVPYTTHGSPDSGSQIDAIRREQFEAVERWFHRDWMRIEPKLRTSIVEGISVLLARRRQPSAQALAEFLRAAQTPVGKPAP